MSKPKSMQEIADRIRLHLSSRGGPYRMPTEEALFIAKCFPEDTRTEEDKDLDMERYSGR